MKKYFVYILKCSDDSFYTGSTQDIEKRILRHTAGRGAKYLRGKLPIRLVYSEDFATRSEAMKRELEIKKLKREGKIQLITLRA